MIELYNIGIDEDSINEMLEMCPQIKELSDNEIREKKELLEKIGCTPLEIINIISTFPMYLERTNGGVEKLVKCLLNYGFDSINMLFDSNPYILGLEPFEIDRYINERISNGEKLEDIVNDLDDNPFLFCDM